MLGIASLRQGPAYVRTASAEKAMKSGGKAKRA